MECRICLEETPPFLTHICGCRGTQQYIHESCLKRWIAMRKSMICDICKETIVIPRRMRMPLFPLHQKLWIMNILLAGFFFFPTYEPMLLYQRFLHLLHSISYLSLLPTIYENPRYLLQWLRPALVLPSHQIVYPLPSLFMYVLVWHVPFFGTVGCLQYILRVHVGIVDSIETM